MWIIFNGNKPTSELCETRSVFHCLNTVDGHSLHGRWNRVDCWDSLLHPPIPKLSPGATDSVDVGSGNLGCLEFVLTPTRTSHLPSHLSAQHLSNPYALGHTLKCWVQKIIILLH